MLKKARLSLATFFTIALTLLFLDYTHTLHAYLGWCAKIQFFPAILSSLAITIAIVLATLLFGRIYCSAICPLGIFQDVASYITTLGKPNRFSYRQPKKAFVITRYVLLALFVIPVFFTALTLSPLRAVTTLLEPYSAYGRIVSQLLSPIYKWGNNILAHYAERAGSYAFYSTDVWLTGGVALAVAALTLSITAIFAWKSGRGYCNGVCPVGSILGLLSNFSVMKIRINKAACTNCSLCAKNCKAGCIDIESGKIDYLRCVGCFNCLQCCKARALSYSLPKNKKERSSP